MTLEQTITAVPQPPALRLDVAGKTDVGLKRTHNEDAFLMAPEHGLFCVADGMGGHSAGEVASALALAEMTEFFERNARDRDITWPYKLNRELNFDENRLATAVKLANRTIHEQSQADPRRRGMGTTLVSALFTPSQTIVAHVGDSRAYRFAHAEKKLLPLTQDHSLLNDYMKAKKLTPEEIEAFPHKNVIVRALGMSDKVVVDIGSAQLAPGDVLMLCCDGLSGMVSDEAMAALLADEPDLERAATKLIAAANAGGGVDNITCILVRRAT